MFIVKIAVPMYDQSTDAYRGARISVDAEFVNYLDAEEYCWSNYNPHEVDPDDIHAWIEMVTIDYYTKTITTRPVYELHANYVQFTTDDVPF